MRSAALAVLFLVPATAFAAGGAASIREARYFEPVEIHGAKEGDKALRYEDGRWREVPSQGSGKDTLIFLAESVGERAPEGAAKGMREARVTDPLTKVAGYVYLAHYGEERSQGAAAIASESADAPSYDEKTRVVRARCYRVAFAENDPALLESLTEPKSCGGSGEELLADFHQTYRAEVRGIGVDVDYDRSRLESKVLNVWQGPVRVRRHLQYRFRLPFGGYTHESVQDADFYPHHYNYPVNLKFPSYFGMLVSSLQIEFATDWAKGLAPMSFQDGGGRSAMINGASRDGEREFDGAPFLGWRMSGPAGTFLNLMRLSKSAPFEALLRYRDGPLVRPAEALETAKEGEDAAGEDEPEDAKDDIRRVGFVLSSKGSMGTRRWRGLSTTIFPKAGDARGPAEFLKLFENPLEVSVDGGKPEADDPAKEVANDPRDRTTEAP